uniref:Uncharacterized protein n=1 Tax=Phlebia radiata TaxID=5308 RepID=L8B9D8_PHLRA|nr:hypothetical protein PRA_mt0184 [Phlebia radiata]CCE89247.1 hypothetical protein PRA_mt0184 [Phlebia radiata]
MSIIINYVGFCLRSFPLPFAGEFWVRIIFFFYETNFYQSFSCWFSSIKCFSDYF